MPHTEDHQTAGADRAKAIEKLARLIKDIDIAMLTTVEQDGALRSRPMATQRTDFDGTLWFLTGQSTPKAGEIQHDARVNLSYAKPDDHRYVSVSGRARLIKDRQRIREFWNPFYKAWFPKGPDDPDIVLLAVDVDQAEYWDSPSGLMVQVAGLLKAVATGQRYEGGDNAKIEL